MTLAARIWDDVMGRFQRSDVPLASGRATTSCPGSWAAHGWEAVVHRRVAPNACGSGDRVRRCCSPLTDRVAEHRRSAENRDAGADYVRLRPAPSQLGTAEPTVWGRGRKRSRVVTRSVSHRWYAAILGEGGLFVTRPTLRDGAFHRLIQAQLAHGGCVVAAFSGTSWATGRIRSSHIHAELRWCGVQQRGRRRRA